jgi:hypothetical protein
MMSRPIRPLDSKVRAKRLGEFENLRVDSKTIGTRLMYSLPTDNISRSGMLLDRGNYSKIPFSVNTLLELVIDPESAFFERPISCMGKVVRTVDRDDLKSQFGVQIIQIDGKDLALWEAALAKLESSLPISDEY